MSIFKIVRNVKINEQELTYYFNEVNGGNSKSNDFQKTFLVIHGAMGN